MPLCKRGSILEAQGAPPEPVEQLYREAVMRARSQQAKWWELRASVSLARLLLLEDRRAEGRTVLEPVYGWFKEGFDAADLVGAKSLLNEL